MDCLIHRIFLVAEFVIYRVVRHPCLLRWLHSSDALWDVRWVTREGHIIFLLMRWNIWLHNHTLLTSEIKHVYNNKLITLLPPNEMGPRQSWILDTTRWISDSRYWLPELCLWNIDSWFQSLVGVALLELYSGFQSLGFRIQRTKFPGFWTPQAKNFPDSGIPYIGRLPICSCLLPTLFSSFWKEIRISFWQLAEGYGQTEATCAVTFQLYNDPMAGKWKLHAKHRNKE